ncbi:MAG TPA: TolC family protein [Candidatus Acidoferrum sp.]|nr:TolC family protein [Candidatus Acidoferrum sp.]
MTCDIRCRTRINALVVALLLLVLPGMAGGQEAREASPLTLEHAVKIALEKNPERKAALAEKKAASADIQVARSFLLPHLMFSETATLGNDPVYVFGSKLRQHRFSQNDFSLSVLNTPAPLGNYSTRFGGTWNLFDSFASWRAVTRAEHVKDAAGHQLERTDQEVIFRVINAYYAVLLAKRDLQVAEQATKTAQAILDRSKDRYESGVTVQSDYLSAQVRMTTRKQELIRTQNNLAFARAQLSNAMGLGAESEFEPANALEEKKLPEEALADAEKRALEMRPDLKRIQSEEEAQKQSAAIAKSAFGPRVNAFGGWQADNPTFVGGGGGNNWLAGLEVQVDLFDGGSKRAQLSRERAQEEKVAAAKAMARDAIQLEVRRAYYDLDAARRQVEVASASISESRESLRINQDRYESGLSTITDLLAAEEMARRTQADYWEALYQYHVSYASLELATGTLNPQSPVVTP